MSNSTTFLGIPKPKLLKGLMAVQAGSGIVFSSFILVHLVPPVVMAISGDESSASRMVLLGREYYQKSWTEPLLILGSVTAHYIASITRRILFPKSVTTLPPQSVNPNTTKGYSTLHTLTGFWFGPLLVYHFLGHRWFPASSTPPINALSPSELDLSYVGVWLRASPIIESLAYGALILTGLWHTLVGWGVIVKRYHWAKASNATIQTGIKVTWVALVSVVGVGLIRLALDKGGATIGLTRRVLAVQSRVRF